MTSSSSSPSSSSFCPCPTPNPQPASDATGTQPMEHHSIVTTAATTRTVKPREEGIEMRILLSTSAQVQLRSQLGKGVVCQRHEASSSFSLRTCSPRASTFATSMG